MYTDITTVEEAFNRHPAKLKLAKIVKALSFIPKELSSGMLAILQLQVVSFVLNNDDPKVPIWEPDYNNTDQLKWGSWWRGGDKTGAGFRFFVSDFVWTNAVASGGARLALKDQGRVMHAKEYFPDLYKNLYLVLE